MQNQDHAPIPFSEKMKGVAGIFGIRTGEEPVYMLLESDGNKEVRTYLPYVVAHIQMQGDDQASVEKAFQDLADYSLVTAPVPENKNIHLESRPAETVAAIEYSGINSRKKMEEKKQELIHWLSSEKTYLPDFESRSAQYDTPMTIPFMRKNEIQISVKEANFRIN